MARRIAENDVDQAARQTAVGGGKMSEFLAVVAGQAVLGANPGRTVRFEVQGGDSGSRQTVGARKSEKLFPVVLSEAIVGSEPNSPIRRRADRSDYITWQAVARRESGKVRPIETENTK